MRAHCARRARCPPTHSPRPAHDARTAHVVGTAASAVPGSARCRRKPHLARCTRCTKKPAPRMLRPIRTLYALHKPRGYVYCCPSHKHRRTSAGLAKTVHAVPASQNSYELCPPHAVIARAFARCARRATPHARSSLHTSGPPRLVRAPSQLRLPRSMHRIHKLHLAHSMHGARTVLCTRCALCARCTCLHVQAAAEHTTAAPTMSGIPKLRPLRRPSALHA